MSPLLLLNLDDKLTLKKKHPCGGLVWSVVRIGADIGITCDTCGHKVLLERSKLETRIKKIERAQKTTV